MVGLTTSLAAAAGYEQAAGYAIPVNETFLRIVEALRLGREVDYGFLGVQMRNLDPRDMADGKEGMRVAGTVAGTPAHRHLQTDDIITHVNGKPIYDADGLVLNVSSQPADSATRLTILRGNRAQQVELDLAKAAPAKRIVTAQAEMWRGMRVEFASAISQEFLIRNDHLLLEGAVVVAQVDEDTPAWRAGLRPEMIISHVGNRRVQSPREFRDAVAGKTGTVQLREIRLNTRIERPVYAIDPE
jgi:serine protease Do